MKKCFIITKDTLGRAVIYTNEIHFEIKNAEEKTAYIQIEKKPKERH